jgi:ABC-type lipoprotein release transport system permease subunit
MTASLRELRLGVRLAFSGGRSSWTRLLLTALGVGLGVALLLVAASVPRMVDARDQRIAARADMSPEPAPAHAGPRTLLIAGALTGFRDRDVRGRLVRAEGATPAVPPGLERLPRPGELFVSPALERLLRSGDGALLRERLSEPVAGTIGDAGLEGPSELAFYLGSDRLVLNADAGAVRRIDHFGDPGEGEGFDSVLRTLAVVVLTALLLPVAVFIAAAVRFGGEARDRRLAALRLLGADRRMTRRIAAGEALAAALLGLLVGALLFLLVRVLVERIELRGLSAFSADVTPSLPLAVAVLVGVPAAAVAVTLLALRGVVVEPLGLVRRAQPRRRRVWWRLVLPLLGVVLLLPMTLGRETTEASGRDLQLAGGVVLVLLGVAALLPWAVEAVVHRLGGGGVAWQLATRRLQLDSGASARVVCGIAVAVAGAIALQTTFSSVEEHYVRDKGAEGVADVWQTRVDARPGDGAVRLDAALRGHAGVRSLETVEQLQADAGGGESVAIRVATCGQVRRQLRVDRCADGDSFLVAGASSLRAGARVRLDGERPWTVPADARVAPLRHPPADESAGAVASNPDPVVVTRGALAGMRPPTTAVLASVRLDRSNPDAVDQVRNAVWRLDPLASVYRMGGRDFASQYANLRRALFIGAIAVLVLIGASMLVGALEQLRERRRPLAVLAAFGTPRSAVARSLLWQTAIPVVLGLALAIAAGLGLGALLLGMVGRPVGFDLRSVAGFVVAGAAVVLVVTAASLPALGRTMRPSGLRSE